MNSNRKVVIVSDTHNLHDKLILPDGDILIHCGDYSTKGSLTEFTNFAQWMVKQNFKYKLVLKGNHDKIHYREDVQSKLNEYGIITLDQNRDAMKIMGLNIWGSNGVPFIRNNTYNNTKEERDLWWKDMPVGLDILVTHCPPRTVLDLNSKFEHCGCDSLLESVTSKHPKHHVFGHIHEASGSVYESRFTKFYNCAFLDRAYKVIDNFNYHVLLL